MNPNAHVVVGVDFSETSDLATDGALGIAASGASQLHALHVIPPWSLPLATELGGSVAVQQIELRVEQAGERLRRHVESRVGHLAAEQRSRLRQPVLTYVRVGPAADCLAVLAAEVDADLVVVGTRGRRGMSRLLLGSVAESTARLVQCPVLAMRPKRHHVDALTLRVPEIEPPCPRCVRTRLDTRGVRMWCDQHQEHHQARHHYFQQDRVQAEVSLPLIFPMR